MKSASRFQRASAVARVSQCGRMPVIVDLTAGLSLMFLVGAFVGMIDPESAIRGGAALAAIGGIGAFLADDR